MQFSTIVALLFAASSSAVLLPRRGHTWCQCYVNDALNGGLSVAACSDWSSVWPNSGWDANAGACADKHRHGSIDGAGWEAACQKVGVKAPYNLDIGAMRGHCWS